MKPFKWSLFFSKDKEHLIQSLISLLFIAFFSLLRWAENFKKKAEGELCTRAFPLTCVVILLPLDWQLKALLPSMAYSWRRQLWGNGGDIDWKSLQHSWQASFDVCGADLPRQMAPWRHNLFPMANIWKQNGVWQSKALAWGGSQYSMRPTQVGITRSPCFPTTPACKRNFQSCSWRQHSLAPASDLLYAHPQKTNYHLQKRLEF